MPNKADYLTAMRAEHIPAKWSNLWFVHKFHATDTRLAERFGKPVVLPKGVYTYLYCMTEGTMMHNPPGELVMEDTPFELATHVGLVMRAHGKVLVTGLGLGCVVRGLLHNPAVEHVTCIEKSQDVLNLVGPYMPTERLTIVYADALKWAAKNKQVFDVGWHDLWTNRCEGEPHLDRWHLQLMMALRFRVKQQSAWGFRKDVKHLMIRRGFPWVG